MSSVQNERRKSKSNDYRDENDVLKMAADRFFEESSRDGQKGRRDRTMKAAGVYIPARWAKRWDFVVAGYLAHFVRYVGGQKRRDGFNWDSARDIHDKTGISPDQQKRCIKVLEEDGAIHVRRRSGQSLMVRPNMPLLMLWDDLPSFDEAVEKLMDEMDEEKPNEQPEEDAEAPRDNAEPPRHIPQPPQHDPEEPQHIPQGQYCKSSGSRWKSSQGEASAKATDPRVDKCLEVLDEIENFQKDRKRVASTLPKLIEQHPKSNPVEVCRGVVDRAATQTITTPTSYLRGAFERDEAKLANEPKNPQGKDAPVFVAPKKEKEPKIDPREIQRLMDEGFTDAQIRAYIRMHTAEQREEVA